MHRNFRKLLENAIGKSEFVIAINIDIRGFSLFSKKVESPETAMFIKRVYMKLIDNYFSNASFFKPTGDGLLLTIPYNEKNLPAIASESMEACLKAIKDFPTFCKNDPMVNFDVPDKIGIGLSRGTACSLVSNKKILDYSGRVLNLASRLMDIARPSGIIFDSEFDKNLFSKEQNKLFKKESIYLKGIAERDSIDIYYTKKLTQISQINKKPLDIIEWNAITDTLKLKEIKKLAPKFVYNLNPAPKDSSEVNIKITHPFIVAGRKKVGYVSNFKFSNFEYFKDAGKHKVKVDYLVLADKLQAKGIKDSWDVL